MKWRQVALTPDAIREWYGTGGFVGARATETEESAARTALVAVSEDASGVNERCILRDVALALAGADVQLRPPIKKIRCE